MISSRILSMCAGRRLRNINSTLDELCPGPQQLQPSSTAQLLRPRGEILKESTEHISLHPLESLSDPGQGRSKIQANTGGSLK